MNINIDFNKINSTKDFHKVFSVVMGFPDFYGNNNDAWIDCMSYIDDKEAGMSLITVKPNESLNIVVSNFLPYDSEEIFLGFIELVTSVNQRFIEVGSLTRLTITTI